MVVWLWSEVYIGDVEEVRLVHSSDDANMIMAPLHVNCGSGAAQEVTWRSR